MGPQDDTARTSRQLSMHKPEQRNHMTIMDAPGRLRTGRREGAKAGKVPSQEKKIQQMDEGQKEIYHNGLLLQNELKTQYFQDEILKTKEKMTS